MISKRPQISHGDLYVDASLIVRLLDCIAHVGLLRDIQATFDIG
jgi:hypothetical protein